MVRDLCFVVMPFGKKKDAVGEIDFDAVYDEVIRPAIEEAGLAPIRADEEAVGGFIHKPMYERLILCKFAVADLTAANANVFYELGIRHAARPWSTVLLFAAGRGPLPFDLGPLRALPYRISPDGRPAEAAEDRAGIVAQLRVVKESALANPAIDSPLFQLLDGYPEQFGQGQLGHERTDVFREQVEYSQAQKEKLRAARREGVEALRRAEEAMGDLGPIELGVIVDLFLSYRAVSSWADMVRLYGRMPAVLKATVMVQEQYALALNRMGNSAEAEPVLQELLETRGPSSETYGLLGRVYKDQWKRAKAAGDDFMAPEYLRKAADTYRKGFETDWRDHYPGINAVTMMELMDPPDPRREALVPVVDYAVERKIAAGRGDYWDYATRFELAVLASDRAAATEALRTALDKLGDEPWNAETTADNLRMIHEARRARGEDTAWMEKLEEVLRGRALAR